MLRSVLGLIGDGATHVGVATDTVIESFRNDLWPGYKSSAGIEPALLAQFPLLEEALRALGVTVWGMVELEADDALAAARARAAGHGEVERVVICTPDKDLAQCVSGRRVVQLDRRAERDPRRGRRARAVRRRAGLDPGLPRARSATRRTASRASPAGGRRAPRRCWPATGTSRRSPRTRRLGRPVRGAARLAVSLAEGRELAELFRLLATLRADAPGVLEGGVEELRWRGPAAELPAVCDDLDAPDVLARAEELAAERP